MPKNDNAHALRLQAALRAVACDQDAAAYAALHPLSAGDSPARQSAWACGICEALTDTYGSDTARCIRRKCRCDDGWENAQEIRRCIERSGSLKEACAMFTRQSAHAFLQYVSEREVIFGYHSCLCSCVQQAAQPVPLLWCECSAGYTEAMFGFLFGKVRVTLLESVASGGNRCAMCVEW